MTGGGNPERLHSDAAFAALCGASPVQASSGQRQRHRLSRGGDRGANCALWTIANNRMIYDPRTRELQPSPSPPPVTDPEAILSHRPTRTHTKPLTIPFRRHHRQRLVQHHRGATAGHRRERRLDPPRGAAVTGRRQKDLLLARILVTGSAQGLGKSAAADLVDHGHQVVVHVRDPDRSAAVADLARRGAAVVVGDLASGEQTRRLADQVNELGRMDAIIHNAGVYADSHRRPGPEGHPRTLAVNTLAPYLLTGLIERPDRLVYLTSGMHRSGDDSLGDLDWSSRGWNGIQAYCDSKLFVTALALAVARRWPDVTSNAVDPGWVPTRMGGPRRPRRPGGGTPHPGAARGRQRPDCPTQRPGAAPPAQGPHSTSRPGRQLPGQAPQPTRRPNSPDSSCHSRPELPLLRGITRRTVLGTTALPAA